MLTGTWFRSRCGWPRSRLCPSWNTWLGCVGSVALWSSRPPPWEKISIQSFLNRSNEHLYLTYVVYLIDIKHCFIWTTYKKIAWMFRNVCCCWSCSWWTKCYQHGFRIIISLRWHYCIFSLYTWSLFTFRKLFNKTNNGAVLFHFK